MTDLGKAVRSRLVERACIKGVSLVERRESPRDGTVKFLFGLSDGLRIETVLIPPASAFAGTQPAPDNEQQRRTICVSTQAGCPLDCAFCATATMGYRRNLDAGEIVDQILHVQRESRRPITNVVFMGMGEPMMNYDNVMNAVGIITGGMGIAGRRITISTAGWVDGIRRMADDGCRARLAVSLHSAVDATRTFLMPVNKRYALAALADALAYYYAKTHDRVTYEVIFFDGINDSDADVRALTQLARRVPSKINVIPYHSIAFAHPTGPGAHLRPSPRVEAIVETLRRNHLTVLVRSNAGDDIAAACGQLAVTTPRARGSRRPATRAHAQAPTPMHA